MKRRINMEEIAKGLGAERRGKVAAIGGYFGAMQLAADVQARFRAPRSGGRATDPNWTKRRLVRMNPRTLKRLEELAQRIGSKAHEPEPERGDRAPMEVRRSWARLIRKVDGVDPLPTSALTLPSAGGSVPAVLVRAGFSPLG